MAVVCAICIVFVACQASPDCNANDAINNFKKLVDHDVIWMDMQKMSTWEFRADNQIEQYEISARAPSSSDTEWVFVGRVNVQTCEARIESF